MNFINPCLILNSSFSKDFSRYTYISVFVAVIVVIFSYVLLLGDLIMYHDLLRPLSFSKKYIVTTKIV